MRLLNTNGKSFPLDEISIAAGTHVAELRRGVIETYHLTPEQFHIERQSLEGLSVENSIDSAALIRSALSGSADNSAKKAAAMIALNAGATIYVSGVAATLADGVEMAEDLLATGQAAEKLKSFIDFTQLMKSGDSSL